MSKAQMMTETECALCGGQLGRILLTHDLPDRFEQHVGIAADNYSRHWIECCECGSATNIHMVDAREGLEAIASAYYDVDFGSQPISEKFLKIMALRPDQSDNAARVERIVEKMAEFKVGRGGAVKALDIGAGTGVFLAKLSEAAARVGWSIQSTAVEPDPNAVAHLRSLKLFDVFEGFFQGQPEFSRRNLITLNKVVEHLSNPHALLRQAAAALCLDDGLLYVEVPDVMTVGRRPHHDNILGSLHHHLYSPRGLERLLASTGLVVMQVSRVFEPSGKITVYGFAMHVTCADRLGREKFELR